MNNLDIAYIKIPSSFTMDYEQINTILVQLSNIDQMDVHRIGLDFTDTVFFSAELSTFLGIIIQHLQIKGYELFTRNLRDESKVGKILSKNGFLKMIMDKTPIIDTYNSTIKYVRVSSCDIETINEYLENYFMPKFESTINSEEINLELKNSFKDSIFEFSDNISAHSHSKYLYMCGQYFYKKRELKMAIADMGITIPKNIKQHKIELFDSATDEKYIDWAIKRGNSTKTDKPGGMGLSEIRESMQKLGHMTVLSNRGYWKQQHDGTIEKKLLSEPFPGTLLHMNILLDKSSFSENKIVNMFENNNGIMF